METFTVSQFVESLGERLSLRTRTETVAPGRAITDSSASRPGLLLAGFEGEFRADRIQLLGGAEISYLESLSKEDREGALARLCAASVPCILVADGREPPAALLEAGEAAGVPVMSTPLPADDVLRELVSQLDDLLAPHMTVHGTLVDVYGVGLLFTGKSGIGKSECGLDLIANGHRLVADDVVRVMRTRRSYLIGYGSELLENYMEIRGVGIIDVQSMYGARALRQRKRIELEVKLASWSELADYERLGFEDEKSEMLGVEIPAVTLPLVLGKNITVISEVIALNYLLKLRGVHAARDFDVRQREAMAMKAGAIRAVRGDEE